MSSFEQYRDTFSARIRDELEASIEDIGTYPGFDLEIEVKKIVDASLVDPDFEENIEREPDPGSWENDWIREYIEAHSMFFEEIARLQDNCVED